MKKTALLLAPLCAALTAFGFDSAKEAAAVDRAVKSASGKAEVWSFHIPRRAHFKFFAPFNGVWGDSPSTLPTAAADAVRTPVVTVARVEEEKKADTGPAVSLEDYLAKYPAIRKIVDDEARARLDWAGKGENAASLKRLDERLAALRGNVANERQQKEIADEEKNIAPLREFADMEARVPRLHAHQRRRRETRQADPGPRRFPDPDHPRRSFA